MDHQHVTYDYMAHGYCFSWEPGLVWLHVVSDVITGIAYYSIPMALFYVAYKRRDLPFYRMFLLLRPLSFRAERLIFLPPIPYLFRLTGLRVMSKLLPP